MASGPVAGAVLGPDVTFSWKYLLELQRLYNAVDMGLLDASAVAVRLDRFSPSRGKRNRIRKLIKPAVQGISFEWFGYGSGMVWEWFCYDLFYKNH